MGKTAVELALSGNLYENSRVLLSKMQPKPDMISPCLWYAATKDVAKFREIIEKHSPFSEGIFALHTSIALGHREIIHICLEQPTFWHVPDKFGYTPLSLAVLKGDKDIIDQILNHRSRFAPSFNRQEIIALIQLSIQHPHKIETILQNLPLETLQNPNEDNLNPLQLAEIYGGPGVSQALSEGFVRVKKSEPHSQSTIKNCGLL
jgi:ankyrin repeat protein